MLTGIDGVKVGDEAAVLLGEDVTAEDHARVVGTIAYEILCGVGAGGASRIEFRESIDYG